MSLFRTSVLGTFCALLSVHALADDPAGRVLLASGEATALRDGRIVRLERGALIEARDQLRTGPNSHLQIRMSDESVIALRGNSALAIQDYRYQGRTDGSENAVFRLLKGGFRTITGLIGRVNKNAYRVDTGVATIGIRGTSFALALCDGGTCRDERGGAARDGLYGTVTEGRIQATNGAGERSFAAGEAFYAASPDSDFKRLLAPPSFLNVRVEPGRNSGDATARDAADTGERQNRPERGLGAIQQQPEWPNTFVIAEIALPTRLVNDPLIQPPAQEVLAATGATNLFPPPDGFAIAVPLPAGSYDVYFSDGAQGAYNAFNQLTSWRKPSTTLGGELGAGEVIQQGSIARGEQVLSWGRWNGGQVTTAGGVTTAGIPLLFVTANAVAANSFPGTLPSSGVVTYAGGFGPGPSAVKSGYFPNQIVGSVVSETLQIDFGQASATLGMTLRFASAGGHSGAPAFDHTYGFTANLGPNANTGGGDFSGTFAGSCVSGCTGSISGKAAIGLTGKDGYGLAVTSGGFADSSSTLSATFIRVFEASSASGVVTTVAQ